MLFRSEQLKDAEGATPYLRAILALDPRHEGAFARLKAIFTTAARWSDLEGLYQQGLEAAEDDASRIELLGDTATLAEDLLKDDAKAIDCFERIVGLDASHEAAIEALERLYPRSGRWKSLAGLLESRLEVVADDAAVGVRLQIGRAHV